MFGYILYGCDNDCVADFLAMYCEGKGYLWNCFWGFQTLKVIGNTNHTTWRIPRKIADMAEEMAHKYDDYEIL